LLGPLALAGGYAHTAALDADRRVWTWGANSFGQLGDGSLVSRSTPAPVPGLGDVAQLSAGYYHTVAVVAGGSVWSWGSNSSGQLGDGSLSSKSAPVRVPGLSGVSLVAAGNAHTVALKADGTVWTWGDNSYGQLGDGSNVGKNLPLQVPGLSGVRAVAAGYGHTVAVLADGSVYAWGYNNSGQLGDGTLVNRSTPGLVPGLSGVSEVAAGNGHTLALKADGTLQAWGYDLYGQLGDASSSAKTAPVPVAGLSGVAAVAAGYSHSLALKSDGTLWSWGRNNYGQLGDGSLLNRNTPTQVQALSGVTVLAAGANHSLALPVLSIMNGALPDATSGTAYAAALAGFAGAPPYRWSLVSGSLPPGLALGGASGVISGLPGAAGSYGFTVGLSDATGQTASKALTLAVHAPPAIGTQTLPAARTGTSYLQPLEGSGGTLPYRWTVAAGSLPAGLALNGASGVIAGLAALPGSSSFTVQLEDANGARATRGFTLEVSYQPPVISPAPLPPATYGARYRRGLQVFGGVAPFSWTVVSGELPYGLSLDGASGVVSGTPEAIGVFTCTLQVSDALSGSSQRVLSLKVVAPAQLLSWGDNAYGQLGDGTTVDRNRPVALPIPLGFSAVDGGYAHTVALAGGSVWTWGYNNSGQLGDGGTTDRSTPAPLNTPSGCVAVAAGYQHTLALDGDGLVWSWGSNSSGQLGDPSAVASRAYPLPVPWLEGVSAVAGGAAHSVALKQDGTVWSWGANADGQLGDGSTNSSSVPVQAAGLSGVIAVAAGHYHTLALKADGTVWAWGRNLYGQLGDGTLQSRSLPQQVPGVGEVSALAAGFYHSLALMPDGSVWAWGYNNFGQLGDGSNSQKNLPVPVAGLAGVSSLSGGYYGSMALKADGSVWTWGYNRFGQLGDGSTVSRNLPVPVPGLGGASLVAGGAFHNYALSSVEVAPAALADATLGVPYRQSFSASGGLAPYTWSVTGGALPDGLVLDPATGTLSGTPSAAGSFYFEVQALPATGFPGLGGYSMTVRAAELAVATATLPGGVTGTPYSQALQASGGSAPYRWSLSSGELPGGLSLDGAGLLSGTPQAPGVYSFTPRVTDSLGGQAARSLSLTVNFVACSNGPARLPWAVPVYLPDFLSAYGMAGEGDTVELQALNFSGDFLLDRSLKVALKGGFNCGYTSSIGATTLLGKLRVLGGTAKIENLRFK
jgi:alpha-tubulin suppressor-like RCC1 family protein